jgi:hypothetical protein
MSSGSIFKIFRINGLIFGFVFSATSLVLTFVGVSPFADERGIVLVPFGFLLPNFVCIIGAGIYLCFKKWFQNKPILATVITNLPASVVAIWFWSDEPLRIAIVWIVCMICCGISNIAIWRQMQSRNKSNQ